MKKKNFISFIILLFLLFIFGVITISLLNKKDSEKLSIQEENIVEESEIVIHDNGIEKKEDSKEKITEEVTNVSKEESKRTPNNQSNKTSNNSDISKNNSKNNSSTTNHNNETSNSGSKVQSSVASNSNTNVNKNNETTQNKITQVNKQEETKEKSIYDYEFNIDGIRSELINIGKNMGLTHITQDEGVLRTPSNSSWASPITGSKNFQGKNLERALKDYVRSMPDIIEAYGGPKIKYFTIYIQNNENGNYTFYFLY